MDGRRNITTKQADLLRAMIKPSKSLIQISKRANITSAHVMKMINVIIEKNPGIAKRIVTSGRSYTYQLTESGIKLSEDIDSIFRRMP